ncbi:hypothetical protein LJB42_002266 [Komagataella kurtzmanii]|nr:hypothetical protein LJB42_002266 [Komagataella kurtzmanii]
MAPISVAFVCLGNICRSPMAEAVFTHLVKEKGLDSEFKKIDSFGTSGYHIDDTPDHRSVACCKKHGVPVNHRGQQISPDDFYHFDYILAMDESNLSNLKRIQPKDSNAVVRLFGDYRTDKSFHRIVEDPYYGGSSGFERNFKQITHFSEEFLNKEL